MPFVKLDCGILNSTLWYERYAREVFITALLMAEPREFQEPVKEIFIDKLEWTGWEAPAGWYGFVAAAGPGIVRRSGLSDEHGTEGLVKLASADPGSRSQDFEGRRMIRIDGGYLILNYQKYREKDHTAAERSKRYRERQRHAVAATSHAVTPRSATQAEAEAEAEAEPKAKTAPRGGERVRQFLAPTLSECSEYFTSKGVPGMEYQKFYMFYESKGWIVGKSKMKNWKAAAAHWIIRKSEEGSGV